MVRINKMIPHSVPYIGVSEREALLEVLRTGMIARGAKVTEFERAVADYLGLNGSVATSSGTSALVLALKSLDIEPQDEVIVPTYVCNNVLAAVVNIGATPVLTDVGEDWNLDYSTVLPCLSSRTKAIIVVHIFGIAADVEPLTQLGVPIIENIAQAFGAEIEGHKTGTFGQLTVCSFQATKCLTTGEGGMILSNDSLVLDKVRSMQALAPMSDIQAAIGISQLKQYSSFLHRRREIADAYFKILDTLPDICMSARLRQKSIFFRFPLRIPLLQFDILRAEFQQRKICVRRGVDSLLHKVVRLPSKDFPNAERCFNETLCIPIYPALADDEVEYIASVSQQILSKHV
jgi:perosamine synthetase